jgi:hypothetical protein
MQMLGDDLEVVDGAAAGDWIKSGLGGEFGAVSQQVPKVFDAYARIFHRVPDADGAFVTWAEAARRLGRTAHREMQWHQIVGSSDPDNFTGSDWPGGEPALGEMEFEELDRLCGVLAEFTVDPEECFFGLCMINHGLILDTLSADEARQAQLELPLGRDHLVLRGPLRAVEQIRAVDPPSAAWIVAAEPGGVEPSPPGAEDPWWREAPNLIWPADRSWLVVSEVDFDTTLVGGTRGLIDALVAAPDLEVYEVEPDTSLAAFADKLNPGPEPDEG